MTKVSNKPVPQPFIPMVKKTITTSNKFKRKLDFQSGMNSNEIVQRCLSFASFHESRCDWAKAYGFELLAMNEYLRLNGASQCEKITSKFVQTCRKNGLTNMDSDTDLTNKQLVDLLLKLSEFTLNQKCDTFGSFDSGISFKALKIAMYLGSSKAAFEVGLYVLNNRQANKKSIQQAFHHFKLAADNGHALSARYTAELYSLSNDVEKSLEYYAIAMDCGDAESAFRLGCFYTNTGRYCAGCRLLQKSWRIIASRCIRYFRRF